MTKIENANVNEDKPDQIKDKEQEIVNYLKDNPDFFQHHLDLLAMMQVPHPSGEAISLIERQLAVFREQNREIEAKNRKMENQLEEMLEIARTNQRVSHHLNVLAKELVEADSLFSSINIIEMVLKKRFSIDYVQLHLFEGKLPIEHRLISQSDRAAFFTSFLYGAKPQCGRIDPTVLDMLFDSKVQVVESAAIIPISNSDDLAILALGSKDPFRYQNDMGTYFLDQLGALISSALSKYQEK